jgi:predicted nucleotidyltransferase component of viral defense system
MIEREEILAKAQEFGIKASDVQRDYVFGWLIGGVYQASTLRDALVLKGGNGLRKGYFPMTRFSDDLDFSTSQGLDADGLRNQFNDVCRFAQTGSGVVFDLERNRIFDEQLLDDERRIFKMRLYFRDFSGNVDNLTLKVRVDVIEHDRIYLPVQTRHLIHPYSDADRCNFEIRVVKLEEALADKMKCLIQRRYAFDLFDLVYGAFIARDLEVDRGELVRTFLRKTIFEPSPVAARDLLLGVPFDLLRGFWDRVVCPRVSAIGFDQAVALLREGLTTLFAPFPYGARLAGTYFPAELRNPILRAGSDMTLLRLTYDNVTREVEPYALVFKRRTDGIAREYFYGYDRTGGRASGPGIKSFVREGIQRIENTDTTFEPQYSVELSKAGDRATPGYFTRPFSSRGGRAGRAARGTPPRAVYTVQCPYCGKRFQRKTPSTQLNAHKDGYGNRCFGRVGNLVY